MVNHTGEEKEEEEEIEGKESSREIELQTEMECTAIWAINRLTDV